MRRSQLNWEEEERVGKGGQSTKTEKEKERENMQKDQMKSNQINNKKAKNWNDSFLLLKLFFISFLKHQKQQNIQSDLEHSLSLSFYKFLSKKWSSLVWSWDEEGKNWSSSLGWLVDVEDDNFLIQQNKQKVKTPNNKPTMINS